MVVYKDHELRVPVKCHCGTRVIEANRSLILRGKLWGPASPALNGGCRSGGRHLHLHIRKLRDFIAGGPGIDRMLPGTYFVWDEWGMLVAHPRLMSHSFRKTAAR